MSAATVLAVLWEWTEETPHSGARFWGCHSLESDGRIRDWPQTGLRPLGAAKVTVIEGQGVELLKAASHLGDSQSSPFGVPISDDTN